MIRRAPNEYENVPDNRAYVRVAAWVIATLVTAVLVFGAALASAQTVTSLCGRTGVATPTSAQLGSGAAYQQLVVGGTAVSPTVPTMASGVVGGPIIGATVQILTGLVNYRTDDTAPTSLLGDAIGPGTTTASANAPYFEVCGSDLRRISLIRSSYSATDSTTNWRFYIPGN